MGLDLSRHGPSCTYNPSLSQSSLSTLGLGFVCVLLCSLPIVFCPHQFAAISHSNSSILGCQEAKKAFLPICVSFLACYHISITKRHFFLPKLQGLFSKEIFKVHEGMYGFIVVHLEADTQDWRNLRQFTISPYTVVYQTYNIGTTYKQQQTT